MGIIDKILGRNSAADLAKNIGDAFDNNFTSGEERMTARNALVNQATSLAGDLQAMQAKIIELEGSGNWLQRSWRPIVMLIFAFIVVWAYFIQPAFFPAARPMNESLDPQFWELLRLGMGGYVIGRSAEKIVSSVSENMNVTVRKSKKRDNVEQR